MRNWIVLDDTFYDWIETVSPESVTFKVSGRLSTPQAINLDAYVNVIAIPLKKGRDDDSVECGVYGIPAGVKWQNFGNYTELIDKGCHALMCYNVLGTTNYDEANSREVVACLFRYAEGRKPRT